MTIALPPVPVMRPVLPTAAAVRPYLEAIDRVRWYSNLGPQEQALRDRLAALVNVSSDQVVTTSSATTALTGAVTVAGSHRWLVPSFTFTATPAAILTTGRDVVFGDVRASDWWLDDASVDDQPDVGWVRVAPFGAPVQAAAMAGRHGPVVIDAAASLGAGDDLSALPRGMCVVFSLHATKVLGAGEGGIVVAGDADTAAELRAWTNFGFAGTRESQQVGFNAKMSEVQAAYAHAALDGWETERAEWQAAAQLCARVTAHLDLGGPPGPTAEVSPYWIVLFPDARITDHVEDVLNKAGIGTRRWWGHGCHLMAAYRDVPRHPLPVTDDIAPRYLGLPRFRDLASEHAERITAALEEARNTCDGW